MPDVTQERDTKTTAQTEEEDLEAQLAYETLKKRREAKKRKRAIIIVIVVVVVLVAIIFNIAGQANKTNGEDAGSQVVTTAVYRGDFSTTVSANGATEPVNSTVVTPEVDGIIENLRVQEGSVVNEGDELFTLKNEELDKAYRDAQSQVDTAQRSLERADKAVDDAYAAFNKAAQAANESGDEAGFDESTLRAAITSAEDAYSDAQAVLETARSKVDDAQAKLDKRTVRAPVSGTIVSMSAQNGAAYGSVTSESGKSSSTANGPLIQISDLSKMKVTVQVNEIDISSISTGQQAKATFSAIPGLELGAVVERIASVSTGSASADGTAVGGGGGVVNYAVDLIIPEPDSKLKPGMTATVAITTQSSPNSLIVPSSALIEDMAPDGSKAYHVSVVDAGAADEKNPATHDVPVEVIMQNNSEAAVKGNLNEGDLVVIGGAGGAGGMAGEGADAMAKPEGAAV